MSGAKGPQDIRKLTELVEQLNQVIRDQLDKDVNALDEKLADYVFFPISHILRNEVEHPARLIEASLKCTTTLVVHGWKAKISPQIVEQLVILLTFIVGGVPGKDTTHDPPEETVLEALTCLSALVRTAGKSGAASANLVEAKNIPALAHTVTVLIESSTDGKTAEIQLQALGALEAIFTSIKDHAALATVLPGVVSNLAKLLSTPAREKTRVLVAAVRTFRLVLAAVLSDLRTRSIIAKSKAGETAEADGQKILSPSWLKATVGQIKLALANVLKLRSSSSEDVRNEVGGLALTLLDECHTTLENCTSILVESAIILEPEEGSLSRTTTSLSDLASIYPELGEAIKVAVYNWITSLPRIMQSADEDKKQASLHNVLRGTQMVARLQLDSSTLEDAISLALRDSVTSLVLVDSSRQGVHSVAADLQSLENRGLLKADAASSKYPLVIMGQESQTNMRSEMLQLLSKVGSASLQVKFSLEMLDYARELQGAPQVASFWLSFELIKAALARDSDMDDFLDFSSVTTSFEDPEAALNELYTHAVSILDVHGEAVEADWRLEAIALEVTAFAASRSREAFRPELIDVLYPIATFLGSSSPQLREHAITTLNVLASSCGYASVSELVVENADYMINSISLRMNTLDITPASTKVLIMMTRLTGPRLIPYLDDVVASIFAALDNYHGYPVFVESLFAVLREVVEQGVKSTNLLLEGRQNGPSGHRKSRPPATTLSDTLALLDKRAQRKQERADEDAAIGAITGHPTQPWGPGKQKQPRGIEDLDAQDDDHAVAETEKEKPPKTPTYALLEKVAALTQHHLTSPTPTLRKSLLDLLGTASPALAADEDAFLPLVNAVWPVLLPRLNDAEPFVVLAACDALAVLCASAGDFLASRFKTAWHDGLLAWCRRKKDEAARSAARQAPRTRHQPQLLSTSLPASDVLVPGRAGGAVDLGPSSGAVTGGLGRFASAAQIWEAATRLLTAVVLHVRVEDEMFDDVLALLVDRLPRDEEARRALEVVNPDAVWFALYERGAVEVREAPVLEGVTFPAMESFA